MRVSAVFRTFSSVQCSLSMLLAGDEGRHLFGFLEEGVGRGCTAFEASARSWRSLDEEERTSSFLPFFLLTAQVSPQQRAESGERSRSSRGGPGEGVGRSRGVGALVTVAGRGGEELPPPFCSLGLRVRIFHSFENEMSDVIGALVVLPSIEQQQHQHHHQH
jgi:hypothetical protein